jgi:YHS domain-containing protein
VAVFVQDPDQYMKLQGISVPCAVAPGRSAQIEPTHRSCLNFEVFYFSDTQMKQKFDEDPLRWCGALTDPVTLQRFHPGRRSPKTEAGGRPYYFVCAENLATFQARPDSFSVPHFRMRDDMGKKHSKRG